MGSNYNEMVAQLMGMGFPHDRVVVALRAAFNNPDRAAEYLFNPEQLQAVLASQAEANPQNQANPQQANRQPTSPQQQQQQQPQQNQQQQQPAANPNQQQQQQPAAANNPNAPAGVPDIQNLLQMLQGNPQLMALLQQQLQQADPNMAATFANNPAAMLGLLQMMGQANAAGAGQAAPQGAANENVIRVTEEEKAAIERLERLGFSRRRAIEAFFACDKNEELAANYLFDQGQQGSNNDDDT